MNSEEVMVSGENKMIWPLSDHQNYPKEGKILSLAIAKCENLSIPHTANCPSSGVIKFSSTEKYLNSIALI